MTGNGRGAEGEEDAYTPAACAVISTNREMESNIVDIVARRCNICPLIYFPAFPHVNLIDHRNGVHLSHLRDEAPPPQSILSRSMGCKTLQAPGAAWPGCTEEEKR